MLDIALLFVVIFRLIPFIVLYGAVILIIKKHLAKKSKPLPNRFLRRSFLVFSLIAFPFLAWYTIQAGESLPAVFLSIAIFIVGGIIILPLGILEIAYLIDNLIRKKR